MWDEFGVSLGKFGKYWGGLGGGVVGQTKSNKNVQKLRNLP